MKEEKKIKCKEGNVEEKVELRNTVKEGKKERGSSKE